ncbi:sn-glycerol-3-phosphate ABC transporter ATP-binding protein UgpC [Aquincola tertiaricarbonis]|uniref:Sn-glycerol-3-phosphate ABC transporter ATP-binding protein UgpC n=1 Tax=Aquincola tertiaricarbonis TaxID=391953 RepID=A0ABY4S1L4_AQUTE|nr:sn-glycerol-3-phosphate ABC transporter ATP-binding protein UgpC [Aquincola tertiaricarbonis]URI06808.1 sn-glycerol-3-phosphate ABC transporter ATP-binding protein UgpC [Aquincola tertiaricarbonis]
MANLQLKGLRKSYGDVQTLHGIDLDIPDGEFTVFVGPSGCGKSTMLRCIAGLEEITAGDLYIGGERVNEVPPARRGIAMVFQSYALYPHMTVAENMGFGLRLAGFNRQQQDEAVARAAQILQIEHLLQRKPKALSGGQRQRVAIGRAIVRKPGVFLFDEPLSNLDAALRVQMRVELARLHRELKTTMIYVTHDQVEAMTLANRIVVFNGGRIEQVGKPMDLYHRPANLFVAGFIGSPKMNFVQGQLAAADASGAQVRLPDGTLLQVAADARALPADSPVTLGLRPEHLGAQAAGDALPANALRGTVQAAEHLGDSTYFYLDVPGAAQAVVVRADPENPLAAGDTALLAVPPQRAHLFDANGQALPRA